MPKQCAIHVAIVWYHFGLARRFKSPDICENHTYKHIYTRVFHFQTFSPILASRLDSRYFIHLMNFGASQSILKPISCYAEIRQSF